MVLFAVAFPPVKLIVLSPLINILNPLPLVKASVLPFANAVHPGSLVAPDPIVTSLPANTSLYENALGALVVDASKLFAAPRFPVICVPIPAVFVPLFLHLAAVAPTTGFHSRSRK